MKLSDLKPGTQAIIKKINLSGSLKRRLMDMGIVPNELVVIEKIAPLGDPIEINIKNYKLSIRKSEAEKIEVEVKSWKK